MMIAECHHLFTKPVSTTLGPLSLIQVSYLSDDFEKHLEQFGEFITFSRFLRGVYYTVDM